MNGPGPLLTDLYQLTMLQAYVSRSMFEPAVFEFFVRRLPPGRSFLIAAGLRQLVDYLQELKFSDEDLAALREIGRFSPALLDYLRSFRFNGDVDALPEGTLVFPDEPIVRVTASLPEAQFIESRLINLLHFQTLIASKAARCVLTVPDKPLIDFGMRRAHGAEAALLAARASYISGFAGTATVAAAPAFGIPLFGTMAHSFVQSHETESKAFEHFCEAQGAGVVLLIDTYDSEAGAGHVVELANRLGPGAIRAVRIDSGDLAVEARRVRDVLDKGGCGDIRIFASGGVDEFELARLVGERAPIDGYGIGTSLDVSIDCPALDCAYKIQEYAGRARRKRSAGKATWPGRKQVFRHYDQGGRLARDVLALEGESQSGEPQLVPVMRAGRLVGDLPGLEDIRARVAAQLDVLPAGLRALDDGQRFVPDVSDAIRALADQVDREFT